MDLPDYKNADKRSGCNYGRSFILTLKHRPLAKIITKSSKNKSSPLINPSNPKLHPKIFNLKIKQLTSKNLHQITLTNPNNPSTLIINRLTKKLALILKIPPYNLLVNLLT